jgi:choline-sulfatase
MANVQHKASQKAPNILIIMADQLAPQFLGCYGHSLVKSPNIDKLAAEGVVFDAAYTNSPLCAPSRFVMMSGRLPTPIAAWDNAVDFSPEIPTVAHYLSAQNYRTCLSGKMHFIGPDQLHGYAERLTTDVYPADYTWHPDWDEPEKKLDWYHNMEVVTKAGPCMRSMYLDYDDEAVFKAKRYLFDHAREGAEQPFFLTVSLIQPHDPYLCRQEKWDLYSNDEIDLPKTPHGAVAEDHHSSLLRTGYGASQIDLDEQSIRNARRAYYGAISDVDDKVGELMETLQEAQLADDTIVIILADHGDMLGERGMWFKMSFLEYSSRIPLIVHAPSKFAARRVSNAVSLADILPTCVDMARENIAGEAFQYATPLDGRSLYPHLLGEQGHDEAIGEYYAEGSGFPMYMIRRGAMKFITQGAGICQLFDLAVDPEELNNLANDPAHAALVASLQQEIDTRYDQVALKQRVLESQHRRAFLKGVMANQGLTWDYDPKQDASKEYIRNSMPIYQLEKKARFPAV